MLQVQYSQRNLAANSQRKYVVTHFVNGVSEDMNASGLPVELKDVILYSPSPSGRGLPCFAEPANAIMSQQTLSCHGSHLPCC